MTVRCGVAHGDPVPITAPPVAAAYHLRVPELAVPDKLRGPAVHLDIGEAATVVGKSVTVAITGVRAADTQIPFKAST